MRRVALNLTAVVVLIAFGCGGGHHETMMDPDDMGGGPGSAFFMSVSPTGGQAGVSVSTPIVMRFGVVMGPGMEEYVDLHRGDLASPVLPMTCSWSANRTTLTCIPTSPLEPHTTYWIHLGGGLMTETGEAIDYNRYGPTMGGQWIQGGMMGGSHGGRPWNTLGAFWHHSGGDYGMAFPFTTA